MRTRAPNPLAVALLGLLVTAGCADSPTPPPPEPPPGYVFTPAADSVSVYYQGQIPFAVRAADGTAVTAVFSRGGTILATGTGYTYAATRVGRDSLRAEVPGAAAGGARDWRIWVDSGYGDRPAPVLALAAAIGARPGTLRVNWMRAAPDLNPLPIARYLVALGRGAPLTELNWDAAQLLEEVPSLAATVGYGRDYAGLAGGDTVWVGVRAEDTAGRLSPLGTVPKVRIAGAYHITGATIGLAGEPIDGVLASVGDISEFRAITGGDGAFNLPRPELLPEGFRDIDRYVLTLHSEVFPDKAHYYDVRTDTLSAADDYPRPVLLVQARTAQGDPVLSADCVSTYAGEFLAFLKGMTNTGSGGNTRLYRWDHYPVSYWVQPTDDWRTPGGFEMGPLAHAAAAAWNARLGGVYFVATDDSVAADVKVVFRNADSIYFGFTRIVAPYDAPINTIIPLKMEVRLDRDFRYLELAQGVVLHEIGHALCIGGHSACAAHIMKDGAHDVPLTGTPGLDTPAEMAAAISDDEVRLVRYIRALPQGINMNQYLLD